MTKLGNMIFSSIFAAILVGCGSSGENNNSQSSDAGDEKKSLKGVFVDAPVANLKYTTDSKNGFTDYNGYAEYLSGETCTFYLGDLHLGTMACAPVMSVYEIVGDRDINYPSQKSKNIARILQSLDEESSNKDKIVLDEGMKNFSKPSSLDLNEAINDIVMNAILSEANTKKVSSTTYSDIGEDIAIDNMKRYITTKHPEKINSGKFTQSEANPFEIGKIAPSDLTANISFGESVNVFGSYILASSSQYNNSEGVVYVFKKEGNKLNQIAKLQASDKSSNSDFGASVYMANNYIVVGASRAGTGGKVYVFKKNSDSNITEIAKLESTDIQSGDSFGSSVVIDENYIAVGAQNEDTAFNNAGAAYLFKINSDSNISQIAKIVDTDIDGSHYFAYSLAMHKEYIVIGATAGNSAYLYKRNSDSSNDVTLLKKFQGSGSFGMSTAIKNDYILVGAANENNKGAAYVYKRKADNDIEQLIRLESNDLANEDYFGASVSISGDYIVVGALQADEGTNNSGAAYIFKKESDSKIEQIKKIQSSDKKANDHLGSKVFIYENNIIVASTGSDSIANNAGAAYIFNLFPEEKPYFKNKPNSTIKANEGNTNSIYSFKAITPKNMNISYSIEGTDANSFKMNDSNLSFRTAPDFENPSDNGNDNNYSIKVIASDVNNKKTSIDVQINVEDKSYFQLSKFLASDAEANDNLGDSIAIDGDYIVVGAPAEDSSKGSAYIFKRNSDSSVTQIAKIQADSRNVNDKFAESVAISGNYIVVGASSQDIRKGSAYVFKINSNSTVSQISKLQASDPSNVDYFAKSVAIDGNYIVAGAFWEDDVATDSGAAYVFKINSDSNISQIAKIKANDAEAEDAFGYRVDISGNYIAVGAYQEDSGADGAGAAYIFKKASDDSNVTQIAKIQAGDKESGDSFGTSIAIDGNYVVVGATGESTGASATGAAYIFKRNSDNANDFTQIKKIQSDDRISSDRFANSVDISGNYIIVGANSKDTNGKQNTGAAYIFKKASDDSSVNLLTSIPSNDIEEGDSYGRSVSISGDYAAIGSFWESSAANKAGAAYLFKRDLNQP